MAVNELALLLFAFLRKWGCLPGVVAVIYSLEKKDDGSIDTKALKALSATPVGNFLNLAPLLEPSSLLYSGTTNHSVANSRRLIGIGLDMATFKKLWQGLVYTIFSAYPAYPA